MDGSATIISSGGTTNTTISPSLAHLDSSRARAYMHIYTTTHANTHARKAIRLLLPSFALYLGLHTPKHVGFAFGLSCGRLNL